MTCCPTMTARRAFAIRRESFRHTADAREMKDLLLSVEARVAEHHARQNDHIVEHADFRFPHVKVAVVRQGTCGCFEDNVPCRRPRPRC